jgi:excisionase family DNA binding protein
MIPKKLTVSQAAEILGVHKRTIWRRIASGDIPATQIPGRSGWEYRIREDDLRKYLGEE